MPDPTSLPGTRLRSVRRPETGPCTRVSGAHRGGLSSPARTRWVERWNTPGSPPERSPLVLQEGEVERVLERVHFPASKLVVLNAAFAEFAPAELIHLLDELSEAECLTLDTVMAALRHIS